MSATDTSALLPVIDGTLTIDGGTASGPVLADQLARLTGGSPIVIRGAVASTADSIVSVRGTASLLNVDNMPVEVTANAGQGGPVVTVRFSLGNGPAPWKFSQSFPDLPAFRADSAGMAGSAMNLLDRLVLSDAAFVLTTAPTGTDPLTGAPVQSGLNFVARCSPAGLVGLLGDALPTLAPIVLSGPIVVPKATEATIPDLPSPLAFAWQQAQPLPGITLGADLGIDKILGTSLRLHQVGLRIYSPPTQAWASANPSYSPMLAAVAKLDVPSAAGSLDLTILGLTSAASLMLAGQFAGVTLGNLAQLVDVVGNNDLASQLPHDVQTALGTLGAISLQALTVQLVRGFAIAGVGLTVGLPGVGTSVLPGFAASNLTANFSVTDPFGADRALSATLDGRINFLGAPFDADIDLTEVSARAELTSGVTLPLKSLFAEVGLPSPPDLTINELQMGVAKDGSYSVAATMAKAPTWTLDLGPAPLTVSDVRVLASKPAAGASSGRFSGELALGDDLDLAFSYQTPGDFTLKGDLPEVRLMQLVRGLTDQAVTLPGGFDVDFTDGSVLIQQAGTDLLFQFATAMDSLGLVAFEARRASPGAKSWGFASGIELKGLGASTLPGLEGLKVFEDLFHLTDLLVVVSSLDDPTFTFPSLSSFDVPALKAGGLKLPSQAGGVIPGLNVFASWNIDTSSRQQQLLCKLLGLNPTLGITLQVGPDPAKDSRLSVNYVTTIDGLPLTCQFGGQVKDGQLGLFLTGSLQAIIQGHVARFDVTLLFVANGAFVSGSMLGSISFDGLTLSNLALVIGSDWGGVPSLGIAATLSVVQFQSSLAVFFNSATPSQSVLAGSVSNLSLKDVVDTFSHSTPSTIDDVLTRVALTGTNSFTVDATLANALDNLDLNTVAAAFAKNNVKLPTTSSQVLMVASQPGKRWFLTDMTNLLHYELATGGNGIVVSLEPQFYSVPQATSIGALPFQQGIYLNTGLVVFSFQGSAKVLVNKGQGISVDGTMSRIVIGTEALFSLQSSDGQHGPRISVATFAQPNQQTPEFRTPHFLLDGQLNLLGVKQQIDVYVNSSGFRLDMNGTYALVLNYALKANFSGPQDMGANGSLNVAIGTIDLGPLGRANVDSGVKGTLDLGVKAQSIWAKFTGGFDFAGSHSNLPSVDLDVHSASLLSLPSKLTDLVTANLKVVLNNATQWASLVKRQVIVGVSDVGNTLHQVFGKSDVEAANILKAAGYSVGEVGNILKSGYKESADQVARALKAAGYSLDDVSTALNSAFQLTAGELNNLLQGVGFGADQVKDLFTRLGGDYFKSITTLFSQIPGFIPKMPDMPDMPKFPDIPKFPDVPQIPDIPTIPGIPKFKKPW